MRIFTEGATPMPNLMTAKEHFDFTQKLFEDRSALVKKRIDTHRKLAKKPQEFDLSPLPLWSDSNKQKELF